MITVNLNPSQKELRQFGWIAIVLLPTFGIVLSLRGTNVGVSAALCAIGAVLFITAVIRPRSLRAVYVGLAVATAPIGWLVSHLVLIFLFCAVLTPIALLWRVRGRDVLVVRRSRSTKSYWRVRRDMPRMESYFHQS